METMYGCLGGGGKNMSMSGSAAVPLKAERTMVPSGPKRGLSGLQRTNGVADIEVTGFKRGGR